MGADQVTLLSRAKNAFRKVEQKIKSSLIDDIPPGRLLGEGADAPSMDALKSLASRYKLSGLLPYESYDVSSHLFFNRDTVGYVLLASPATGLSQEHLQVLNGLLTQGAPAGTIIQISLYADPNVEPVLDHWASVKGQSGNAERDAIYQKLAQARVARFKEAKWDSLFPDQAVLVRNFQLMISYAVPVPPDMAAVDLPESEVAGLLRQREAMIGTLSSAGIFAKPMDADQFVNILNGLLNPSSQSHQPLRYEESELLSKQIVSRETLYLPNSGISTIVHGEERYSVIPYHVRQFPMQWAGFNNSELIGSFTNNILRIRCPFVLSLVIHVPDQVSARGVAQSKQIRATQMADSPIAKFVPQWRDRKLDWDYTAKKVDQGDKFLQAFYEIVLIAREGQEQAVEQDLRSTYGALGWNIVRSRYTPMHSLLASLPMGLCQEARNALTSFGHFSTRLSWTCTNVAPWVAEWKGTKTPMMMFLGRRGQVFYFDPFDNDKGNYNISCCAASGGGKSFFTQEWVENCMASGGRAFVIDAGHSYRNLCEILGGTYIDFGEGRPILNPFTKFFDKKIIDQINADPNLSVDEYIMDHLPMLQLLLAQMASPKVDLTPQQLTALEKAIRMAIDDHGPQTSITKVADALMAMNDPETGRVPMPAREVAEALYPYTKDGMHGRYFEGDNNINLDNPFVVLELDALNAKGDLQSVVLLILMMQINQVMYLSGNKKQRKLCIIDEAWRLLGAGRAGKFIEEGYRVARKHGGSFMTITQKVSDYFSSETAQAAYMNSDFEIYLRQKPQELQSAENKGHIDNTGGRIDVLRSLETKQKQYSELAINSPDGLAVARFIVDKWTEKLYSTDPQEVSFLLEKKAQGVPLVEAIDHLVQQAGKR